MAAAIGVASVAHAEPVNAFPEDEPPSFSLVYSAPVGCPDRDAFATSIRERTARPRLVTAGDKAAVALRVVIETNESGAASGRLELREPDGTEETRSVASRSCAEVSSALALVAAVMLDPEAGSGGEPRETIPSALPPSTPPKPPPPSVRSPASPPKSIPETLWLIGVGVRAGIFGGIGPAVAPTGGVFGAIERRAPALDSSLRLSLDVAATSSALRTGSQTYEWLGATARLCPAYLSLGEALRIAPCAGFQVGALRGTTRDVRSPTTDLQLWLAPSLGGTLDWALSPAVSLELEGGVLFPLRRPRFFLAPDSTIFEVPQAAGTVTAGVRVRFL